MGRHARFCAGALLLITLADNIVEGVNLAFKVDGDNSPYQGVVLRVEVTQSLSHIPQSGADGVAFCNQGVVSRISLTRCAHYRRLYLAKRRHRWGEDVLGAAIRQSNQHRDCRRPGIPTRRRLGF